MAKRFDNLNDLGNGIYRDPDKRVQLQLTVKEDNLPSGVPIEGNTVAFISRRVVSINVNAITNYGREIPILEGSMKLKFAVDNPNGINETICDESPITNGENNILFTKNDLIDTFSEIFEVLDDFGVLF